MGIYRRDGGPGRGFFPADHTGVVWNRGGATAVAVGDVMMFDINQGDTADAARNAAHSALPGNDGFPLANVIDPIVEVVADTLGELKYCVVTDLLQGAGADNTLIRVATSGVYDINIDVTSILTGVIAVQVVDTVAHAREGNFIATTGGTAGFQFIAKPLEVVALTAPGLCSCWVNCEGGFGSVV